MSKIRKILITLLTLISAVCLTLVGCGQTKVEFVDFENKTINYDLGDIFDAREYMDVYDVNGNMYLANIKITDADGESVSHISYQFVVEKSSYKVTITVKDGDNVIGTREITINGVDNTPPYITLLDMPNFGVYNEEVFVPVTFVEMTPGFNKKLVVEQYVTNKVDGEYVTTLDTQNAIVKTTNDFVTGGVSFTPTKPGTYKISVYAWDANKTEADARVASKTYSIKENADAWGEIEAFDSPDALVANYHYYNAVCEYNELRGEGQLVYVKNDAGDYLDAEGNILYKRVDEISTNNRIAFYKKADAQSTDYDVLAYYQDMTTYSFYNAAGEVAQTKEGCVTVKTEDGVTDYKFNNKFATIGEEWYQEFEDAQGTTKFGVIKANASQHSYDANTKRFFFKSSYRDTEFFRTYNDTKVSSWMENPQFDYLSIWMLIMPKDANETQTTVSVASSTDFHKTNVPVGEWFEYKVSKSELRIQNYYPYYIFSAERTSNPGGYVIVSNTDYYNFDFYFDNFSYAKGADITVGNDALLMGQKVTIDVANCGELTKDDFKFYVGKARDYVSSSDTGEGVLSSKAYNNTTNFVKENVLISGNEFIPELESGLTSRKYYIQAMLNEQGLAKNNGEQIYASKVIVVNNVNVTLSSEELGQQVTISASLDGVDGVTFAYYYKETSATEWTTLDSNVFTPSKPTSYDVKVVATAGSASVEKLLTKDYTKEIALEVLPATGDKKLLINKDLTIVAELPGSIAITLEVVDSENNPVTITDGKINVAKMGVYTVTANTTFNGVAITKTIDIRVSGPAQISATMAETATIGLDESLEITASTDAQYTLKYSAKLPTGTIIALESNVLPVGLVGDYEVYVTAYNDQNAAQGEEILYVTVNAMTYTDMNESGIY
ncbi:MAG: hypothetical protein IJW26_00315, partial [Clostridia bacterium]|nr:hypothetical protein [Clostridia bacterium]